MSGVLVAVSTCQEREAFLVEVTAERRRLAEEAAGTSRAAEEARANLLDLKGRVAEYEAAAAAALRQARQEEASTAAVRAAIKAEQGQLAAAKKELEVSVISSAHGNDFDEMNVYIVLGGLLCVPERHNVRMPVLMPTALACSCNLRLRCVNARLS